MAIYVPASVGVASLTLTNNTTLTTQDSFLSKPVNLIIVFLLGVAMFAVSIAYFGNFCKGFIPLPMQETQSDDFSFSDLSEPRVATNPSEGSQPEESDV